MSLIFVISASSRKQCCVCLRSVWGRLLRRRLSADVPLWQCVTVWCRHWTMQLYGRLDGSGLRPTSVTSLVFSISYYTFATPRCRRRHYVFWLSVRRVRPFVVRPDRSCCHDFSWTAWAISMKLTGNILQHQLNIRLDSASQRSNIKVTAGWWMHPRRRWGVEVHLLVLINNSVIIIRTRCRPNGT